MCKIFIWKTFRSLLFSNFLMRTIPSIVKQAWTNPLRFNFLPLRAIFSFINVKFLLRKTLVFWLKPCFSLSKFCNFLLYSRAFLCFLFRKRFIVFYLFLPGFPNLWHNSTSFAEKLASVSESSEITVSSKSLSEICPEIPETAILFLLSYCSNALTEDSLDTAFSLSLFFFL